MIGDIELVSQTMGQLKILEEKNDNRAIKHFKEVKKEK